MSIDPKTNASEKPVRKTRFGFGLFSRSEDGAVAIEFAVVALPFFIIIFAIMEVGLGYIANRFLAHSTDVAARMVRTGEVRSSSHTEQQFKDIICNMPTMAIFDCGKLSVDVQTVAQFNHDTIPTTPDGEFDPSNFSFSPGGRVSINIVRTYYRWPIFFNWAGLAGKGWFNPDGVNDGVKASADWYGSDRLIIGTSAFVTEPY